MSAIRRVVASQGWSLRGVPLYINLIIWSARAFYAQYTIELARGFIEHSCFSFVAVKMEDFIGMYTHNW